MWALSSGFDFPLSDFVSFEVDYCLLESFGFLVSQNFHWYFSLIWGGFLVLIVYCFFFLSYSFDLFQHILLFFPLFYLFLVVIKFFSKKKKLLLTIYFLSLSQNKISYIPGKYYDRESYKNLINHIYWQLFTNTTLQALLSWSPNNAYVGSFSSYDPSSFASVILMEGWLFNPSLASFAVIISFLFVRERERERERELKYMP